MAKNRGILIGLVGENKLYYLLDEPEPGRDAAIVDSSGNIEFINFLNFISTTNSKISQLKFSNFHSFIWSPDGKEQEDRWERVFVNKTQTVSEQMLTGVDIIEIKPKNKTAKKSDDAAYFFRRLLSSPSTSTHPLYVQRKDLGLSSRVISGKALGRSLASRPSVDGDGDGFVDDGLPTMRPFIPGFDFVIDAIAGSRSLRTSPANTANERAISAEAAKARIDGMMDFVESEFHGSKPIRTKAHAMSALTAAIPSFGETRKELRSSVDFLDALSDNEELQEWQRQYIGQFLLMVGTHPLRNTATYDIEVLPESTPPQVGGATMPRPTAKRFNVKGLSRATVVPEKSRKAKIRVQYRGADTVPNRAKLAIAATDRRNRNYNVMSASMTVGLKESIKDAGLSLRFVESYAGLATMKEQVELSMVRVTRMMRQSPALMSDDDIQQLQIEISKLAQAGIVLEQSGLVPDSEIRELKRALGQAVSSLQNPSSAQGGVARQALSAISEVSDAYDTLFAEPAFQDKERKLIKAMDEWKNIDSTTTGIHESTHVLQFLSANAISERRAVEFRRQFLAKEFEQHRLNLGRELSKQEMKDIADEFPIEAFFVDVLFDELRQLGESDPDELRFRILNWGMAAGSFPNHDPQIQFAGGVNTFGSYAQLLMQRKSLYEETLAQIPDDALFSAITGETRRAAMNTVQQTETFFKQPVYGPSGEIKITGDVSRLLSDIASSVPFGSEIASYNEGDALTVGHVAILLDVAQYEIGSRTTFRGLGGESIVENFPSVLRNLGFPKLELATKVEGLSVEESAPIAEAMFAISRMGHEMGRIPTSPTGMLTITAGPGKADIPAAFGDVTLDEFMKIPVPAALAMLREAYDEMTLSLLSTDRRNRANTTANVRDLPRYLMHEFGPLTEEEIEKLFEITGKVGLPTGRAADPSYTAYQGTILAGKIPLMPQLFSLYEFGAETATAEFFGLPTSLVNESGIDTRMLTNEELQILNKYFSWIFSQGLPSDLMGGVYA